MPKDPGYGSYQKPMKPKGVSDNSHSKEGGNGTNKTTMVKGKGQFNDPLLKELPLRG